MISHQVQVEMRTMIAQKQKKSLHLNYISLTLLLVSRAGSCGLMHAWAILMTCSSFLGCSSTLAARNNVVWEMIYKRKENLSQFS